MKEESLLLLSDLQKLINQVVLIDYTIIILGGEILYDSEPEEGKPEWMLRADRASRKRHGIYS